MKKLFFIFLASCAIALFSSTAFSQKAGSSSMQFLKVMPVARATAMGDAYSVLASGADAVFWNPAGIVSAENSEISMTYIKWIFDTQQGALSYASSIRGFGSIGLQVQYVDFGEIPEAIWQAPYTSDVLTPGATGRTFRPFSYLVGASYAAQITNKFSTGLSVKFAHESLYDGSTRQVTNLKGEVINANTWANGLIFDFGLQYNTGFRSVKIGASVQNFGPNVKYAVEGNPLPLALRVGIAADLLGHNALFMQSDENRITAAFDLFQPNDYAQQAHAGIEYEFEQTLSLRAGYKFNYDADGLTAGVGFQHQSGPWRFLVDYSYGAMNYNLGNVHRISLGVKF